MPPIKPRYLALVTIIAVLAGIWLGREQLAESAITSTMHAYGLKDTKADVAQIGTGRSHLDILEFSIEAGTGVFRLSAEDAIFEYAPEQLMLGRAENLRIERLTVHHEAKTGIPGDAASTLQSVEPIILIATLRRALREYIIVNTLHVGHLAFHGESFGRLDGKPLRLHAARMESAINTELALLDMPENDKPQILRRLVISELSHDGLTAELGLPHTPDKVPAGVDLEISDTRIEGDYFVEPELLTEWLRPFAVIGNIDGISRVKGGLSVDFSTDDNIELTLTARSERVELYPLRSEHVDIKLIARTPASDPLQQITFDTGTYASFKRLSHEIFTIDAMRLNINGLLSSDNGTRQFEGGINSPSAVAHYQAGSVRFERITGHLAAGQESLNLDGRFSATNLPAAFGFDLEHQFTGNKGRLAVSSLNPVNLQADTDRLSLIWTPWPYPFDLLKGSLNPTLHADWSENSDTRLNTRIKIENGGGHYGEMVFTGLSVDHHVQILPALRSIEPGNVSLSELDSGVVSSNISSVISLETTDTGPLPRLVLKNLYGEIFDGSFSGHEIVFDLNSDNNRFELEAENIDLAAVVATQQLEDIEVTGRIYGTIPVSINQQGIFIEHGAFINDVRAGTIRYNPATGTEQLKENPLTGIALDALRDFRYSHLSADVNFTPDGLLVVKLQLEGTSPELDTRRPVHLNINTEQNLLSLLKSLRYAESVGASIEQRIRDKYKPATGNNQDYQ